MSNLPALEDAAVGIILNTHNEEIAEKVDIGAAALADKHEHNMTIKDAWKIHKKAIFWSMALSWALVMEGYDVVVIGSFYGQSQFCRRFGEWSPRQNKYVITAEWQSGLSNSNPAGGIIGLLINGMVVEIFGARKVMLVALVAITGFIFIFVFAQSLTTLVIAEVLAGIPWGIFQTLTTAYAADVCPIHLRGYLTSYVNLCWGVGILLSSGVVRATLNLDPEGDWSWRLPFVLQWIWPPFLIVIVWFCPESPWWLVRKGRFEEAERNVMRLSNPKYVTKEDAKRTVAMMQHTTELERQQTAGSSYKACFTGVNRRRTEIAMMVFAMQLLSGENLIGQGVQFLQDAGMNEVQSFDANMGLTSMFVVGTIASWFLMPHFGRRTLYLGGMIWMFIVLLIIGILGFYHNHGIDIASGVLLIVLNFVYNATLGPICYTLIAEVGSTRLRQQTVALSRIAYQIMNIVCGIIVPRQLNSLSWNWGAKAGLFWAGSALLCCFYIWLRVPETEGRSYGELDLLFENGVPAWRFSKTKVDQFGTAHHRKRSNSPVPVLDEKEGSIKEEEQTL